MGSSSATTTDYLGIVSAAEAVSYVQNSTEAQRALESNISAKNVTLAAASSAAAVTYNVSDAAGWLAAMSAASVQANVIVNVTSDFSMPLGYGGVNYSTATLASLGDTTLIIKGNGHTIDFGNSYTGFAQGASQNALIEFDDLTMYGASYWGPVSYYGDGIPTTGVSHVLTYDNVTYTGAQLAFSTTATINIAGTVNVNSVATYTSAFNTNVATNGSGNQQNFQATTLNIENGATYNGTTVGGTFFDMLNTANTPASLNIGNDATVTLKRLGNISPENWAGSSYTTGNANDAIYVEGSMNVGENSTVTLDGDTASTTGQTSTLNTMIRLDGTSTNSANLNLAQNSSVTINNNYGNVIGIDLTGAGSVDIANSAKLTINNASRNSAIYVGGAGTITADTDSKLIVNQTVASTAYGVLYLYNGGNFYVNNGATFDINATNQGTSANSLIYLGSGSLLSYGKDSTGLLSNDSSGNFNLITVAGTSSVHIYRVKNVEFDLGSNAGSSSKIFNMSGTLDGQYVFVSNANGTYGAYKSLEISLSNGVGTSTTAEGDTVAVNDASSITNTIGTSKQLIFTGAGADNTVSVDTTNEITDATTEISGTATPNAYITLQNVAGSSVGSTASLSAGSYADGSYMTQADSSGNWSIAVSGLTANTVLVVKAYYQYVPVYTTAYIYSSVLGSETSAASSAAAAAGTAVSAANDNLTAAESYANLAASYASEANSFATANSNSLNSAQNTIASSAAAAASTAATSAEVNFGSASTASILANSYYASISAAASLSNSYAVIATSQASQAISNSLSASDATAISDATAASSYASGVSASSLAASSAVSSASSAASQIESLSSQTTQQSESADTSISSLISDESTASNAASMASEAYAQMLRNSAASSSASNAGSSADLAANAYTGASASADQADKYASEAKSDASSAAASSDVASSAATATASDATTVSGLTSDYPSNAVISSAASTISADSTAASSASVVAQSAAAKAATDSA
ncbi:beta strand repeat-containing protein, partial [Levilactobacillus brevis]|uniref:beta strand repeat-containing protein n=1 Tax=Levilactobacillus brevis TaxID=1580 RepID=UPI00352E8600